MRILVASGAWYPERNGVSRVATETTLRLARRGHDVTALVPEGDRDCPGGVVDVRPVIERGVLPLAINDVIQTTKRARDLKSRFDLVLAHGSMAAVGLARGMHGLPLVFVFHASLPRELRFLRSRLPWGRDRLVAHVNQPIAVALEYAAMQHATRIVVLSEFSRSLIASDHPRHVGKVRLVSGGVDTEQFTPGDGRAAARERLRLDPSRRLLVAVRRAEPRMGLEQLLRAFRILGADDLDLVIAGGGGLEHDLRRLAVDIGIEMHVHFLGRVEESGLVDLYRSADLCVMPTVAYEGFGMVTVEALAAGVPVVCTPVGANPELIAPLDRRLVAQGADERSLATALREALSFLDDDLRCRCRDYAVERFGWDTAIVRWEHALGDAAGPQSHHASWMTP